MWSIRENFSSGKNEVRKIPVVNKNNSGVNQSSLYANFVLVAWACNSQFLQGELIGGTQRIIDKAMCYKDTLTMNM